MNRSQKEEKLKRLIEKSILLDDKDAGYWLDKLTIMPDEILMKAIAAVEKRNLLCETYLKQALKNEKNEKTLEEMRELVNTTQKTAVSMEEKYLSGKAEEDLLKEMNDHI